MCIYVCFDKSIRVLLTFICHNLSEIFTHLKPHLNITCAGGFGSNALFGAAVNRAFGSDKAARSAGSANAPSFLNENGMDVDELYAQVSVVV